MFYFICLLISISSICFGYEAPESTWDFSKLVVQAAFYDENLDQELEQRQFSPFKLRP